MYAHLTLICFLDFGTKILQHLSLNSLIKSSKQAWPELSVIMAMMSDQ